MECGTPNWDFLWKSQRGPNSFHYIVSSRAQQTCNGEQKEKAEGENEGGRALGDVASIFPASST